MHWHGEQPNDVYKSVFENMPVPRLSTHHHRVPQVEVLSPDGLVQLHADQRVQRGQVSLKIHTQKSVRKPGPVQGKTKATSS